MALEANGIRVPKSTLIFKSWYESLTDEDLENLARDLDTWPNHKKRGAVRFSLDVSTLQPSPHFIQGQTIVRCFYHKKKVDGIPDTRVDRIRSALDEGMREHIVATTRALTGGTTLLFEGYRRGDFVAEDVAGFSLYDVVNPHIPIKHEDAIVAIRDGIQKISLLDEFQVKDRFAGLIQHNRNAALELLSEFSVEQLTILLSTSRVDDFTAVVVKALAESCDPEEFQEMVSKIPSNQMSISSKLVIQSYWPGYKIQDSISFNGFRWGLEKASLSLGDHIPVIHLTKSELTNFADMGLSARNNRYPNAIYYLPEDWYDAMLQTAQLQISDPRFFGGLCRGADIFLDMIQEGRILKDTNTQKEEPTWH